MTQSTDGWITASTNGACVEVKHTTTGTLVRDSKSPDGPHLEFSPDEWAVFLAGVEAGQFHR